MARSFRVFTLLAAASVVCAASLAADGPLDLAVLETGDDAPDDDGPADQLQGALPGGQAAPVAEAIAPVARIGVRFIPERWTVPETTVAAIRAVATAPLGRRMEAASHDWLGLPYLNEAAGEQDEGDPDPPARYDSFDCLTFVEEVLGLSLSGDPLYAPSVRDSLRYRDAAPRPGWRRSYDQRRHFMEAEWLPDAVANRLLTDVTDRVGPARRLDHPVTAQMWQSWGHTRFFHLPKELYPTGTWSMQYLDLATAEAFVANIPPGALVVTLRQPRAWKPVVITHVSLVVQEADGKVHMRHATRMGSQKVRDDDLAFYIRHLSSYTNWPSLGISVYMPQEQGPRVSALTTPPLPPSFLAASGLSGDLELRP